MRSRLTVLLLAFLTPFALVGTAQAKPAPDMTDTINLEVSLAAGPCKATGAFRWLAISYGGEPAPMTAYTRDDSGGSACTFGVSLRYVDSNGRVQYIASGVNRNKTAYLEAFGTSRVYSVHEVCYNSTCQRKTMYPSS